MKNLIGKRWGAIEPFLQRTLLKNAYCVDGQTGDTMKSDGDCIVDLTEELSISGAIVNGEIEIDDNAIIYCPKP